MSSHGARRRKEFKERRARRQQRAEQAAREAQWEQARQTQRAEDARRRRVRDAMIAAVQAVSPADAPAPEVMTLPVPDEHKVGDLDNLRVLVGEVTYAVRFDGGAVTAWRVELTAAPRAPTPRARIFGGSALLALSALLPLSRADEVGLAIHGPFEPSDCTRCKFNLLPHDGGHCYVFNEHPKNRCAQRTYEESQP